LAPGADTPGVPPEPGWTRHPRVEDQPTRMRLLAGIGDVMADVVGESLDLHAVLRRIADLTVPSLADWCTIDLIDDGEVRRLLARHADPAMAAWAEALTGIPPDITGRSPIAQALRTRSPQLVARVEDALLEATTSGPRQLEVLRALGISSTITIPLLGREGPLGVLSLCNGPGREPFGEPDLLVAHDIGRRAAMAIDNARLYQRVSRAEQRFRTLVESLDAIVWEADPVTLRTTFVNQRAEDLLGYPARRWLEEPDFWQDVLIHPDDREHILEVCQARLRAGLSIDIEYRMVAADGTIRWIRDISDTVLGDDGKHRRIRGLMVDVTDRHELEAELRFSTALLEAQNEAGIDGVLVVSPEGRMLSWNQRFLELWGIPEEVVATRSDQAALVSVLDKLVDPEGFLRVVQATYANPSEPRRDEVRLRDGRVFDRYGAPLRGVDGLYRGWAWYVRDVTDQKRAERELAEAGERSARMAQTLQQSLLPPELPRIPGVEVAARYRPLGAGNEVGGDFYDVFRTGRGSHAVFVGDVCGKGAEAAALTALARYTMRAAAMQTAKPSRVLRILNEAVIRQRDDDRFVTVSYAALRRGRRGLVLTVASGGHPLPLLVTPDGEVRPLGQPGALIGILPEVALTDHELPLRPGDTVVWITDGVLEARSDGDEYGQERLAALLAACGGADADTIAGRIEADVLAHTGGVLRDDSAVLVLRVLPEEDS
jgi:PAS domain S-box-containing protein